MLDVVIKVAGSAWLVASRWGQLKLGCEAISVKCEVYASYLLRAAGHLARRLESVATFVLYSLLRQLGDDV